MNVSKTLLAVPVVLLLGSLAAQADEPYPEGLPTPGGQQQDATPDQHHGKGMMEMDMHGMMSGMSDDQTRTMMHACMNMMQKGHGATGPESDS